MKNILKSYYHKLSKNYQAAYLLKREFFYFNSCKTILDIGCGEGDFLLLDKVRITGIDTNKKSIQICHKKKLKARYGSGLKIPFQKNSFDGVHCSHLIEHFFPEDAYKMLLEICRVLKPGGIFVLSTPIMWDGFYNDFTHIKPYNPESIERYLCNNGSQKTLHDFPGIFKRLKIEWRFTNVLIPGRLGKFFANYLYQYGLHTLQKNAYMLVLKKEK